MADGTVSVTTEGGQQFFKHFYSYMDTGRSNLKVRAGTAAVCGPPPSPHAVEGGVPCRARALRHSSATPPLRVGTEPPGWTCWGRVHVTICLKCLSLSVDPGEHSL